MKINFILKIRRIFEPILLGSISNIIVNYIFDPYSSSFPFDEFITASILCIPITELNRYIDKRLESKTNWIKQPLKRFASHLALITLSLLIIINVFGNAYLLVTKIGLFSFKETIIINLVTLVMALFLTFFNWAVYFYFRWIGAENIASENARFADELKPFIVKPVPMILIQKGTRKVRIEPQNICYAKIDLGIVRIYCFDGLSGIFQYSLAQLQTMLPEFLFFRITRDVIIHRDAIKSISSSTFGKIQVVTIDRNNINSTYNVSRPKAASFRKWYYCKSG